MQCVWGGAVGADGVGTRAANVLYHRGPVWDILRYQAPLNRSASGKGFMSFRVDLDRFRGPLDLLLYLVRRREIALGEIPLAAVAQQFWDAVQESEATAEDEANTGRDVDQAAEFLDLASTLIEMKSRLVLPREEEERVLPEPVGEALVARLLDYKRIRDAASLLDEQGRRWRRRLARTSNDQPPSLGWDERAGAVSLELWDVVGAYARLTETEPPLEDAAVPLDDTPLQVYMERIQSELGERRRVSISDFFQPGMSKAAMIGVFLAILELVRHHSITTEQDEGHGEIWVSPGTQFGDSSLAAGSGEPSS